MKLVHTILRSCVFIIGVSQLVATPDQEIFLQANQAYNDKDYTKALNLYESIPDKGTATLYNMGNTSFKLGKEMQALLFYKRALQYASNAQRSLIEQNVSVINEKLGIEEQGGMIKGISRFSAMISLWIIQVLFLLLWFFSFKLLYLFVVQRSYLFMGLLILINVMSSSFVVLAYQERSQAKVIAIQQVSIYAGPSEQYLKIGEVQSGYEGLILESRDGWLKIRIHGRTGWVDSKLIEQL